MRYHTDTDVAEQTVLKTGVRIFPVVVGVIAALGIGTALYVTKQLPAVVPPSPISVTGSTQTAVWEVNDPADYNFDGAKISIANGKASQVRRANWWDTNYQLRKPLAVTAGVAGATAGRTLLYRDSSLPQYVSFGLMQPDHDDLRIVYWNGSVNTEIPRDFAGPDEIRFHVQVDIAPNAPDAGYYLYFNNPSVTAPSLDLSQFYEHYEGFGSNIFQGPAGWSVSSNPASCQSAPAFAVSGGELVKQNYTAGNCFAWNPNWGLDATKDWYLEATIRVVNGDRPSNGSLHLHDSLGLGGYWAGLSDDTSDVAYVQNSGSGFTPSGATTVNLGTNYRVTWKYDYSSDSSRVHTVWQDGSQKLTGTDTEANFGGGIAYAGVHAYNPFSGQSTATQIAWDDLKVWEDIGATVTNLGVVEGQYDTSGSLLEVRSGKGLRYGTLHNLRVMMTSSNGTSAFFILSPDNGSTWIYFNGSGWVPSNGTVAQATDGAMLNGLLQLFQFFPFPTNGTLRWKAFLKAGDNGRAPAVLDQVAVRYTPPPNDLDADEYASVASGGSDCVDALTSTYSNGTTQCHESDPPTFLATNRPSPDSAIADHAWVQDDSGLYHLFFQNIDLGSGNFIQHFTSTDLRSLTYVGPALQQGAVGSFDEYALWAPHVIKKDGTYYLFYSGVGGLVSGDDNGVQKTYRPQRIGLATSTDLTTWTKHPGNDCSGTAGDGCVYDCNEPWTLAGKGVYLGDACRDPMIMFDPQQGKWAMFMTTQIAQGWPQGVPGNIAGSRRSDAISQATSSDLIHWSGAGFIKDTRSLGDFEGGVGTQQWGGVAENAFVTQYNGTYYLFFTDWRDTNGDPNNPDDGPFPIVQYVTSSTLTADAQGSFTNWTYRGGIPDLGVNAIEVMLLNNDTWVMSQSVNDGNSGEVGHIRELRLKRMVWDSSNPATFTTSKLTKLACRLPSDSIHPGADEVCGDRVDNNCNGQIDDRSLCPCMENWQCDGWSDCPSGLQTRTCVDANACGTTINQPPLSRSCGATKHRLEQKYKVLP